MHNNYRILFKLTTRSRPDQALNTLNSIHYNVTSDNYFILLSIDADDTSLTKEWKDGLSHIKNLHIQEGISKNKIDAINRDMDLFPIWDILVNVSDDQVFFKKGFDESIRYDMHQCYHGTDGVLHYPDGNRKDLMTLSIIGHEYYNRDNHIYNPIYVTSHCDDEAQQVAILRGRLDGVDKYTFIDNHFFNHNHPAYGKGIYDKQYEVQLNPALYNQDKINFDLRKSINFGLIKNDIDIQNHNN